jgi:dolichyldiphosphatase
MNCPALKPFGLTYVRYAAGDHIGLLLSVVTLLPILIPAQLGALLLVRRDWETLVFFVGIIGNVAINGVLKHAIREPRPFSACSASIDSSFGVGSHEEFGMPSNHAQFMGFVAMFMTLYLGTRVKAPTFELIGIALASWFAAGLCSYSRVYLGYHTPIQVVAGTGAGALAGAAWFALYIYKLAPLGRQLVNTDLFRRLLIREHSTVGNVLKAEYNSLRLRDHKIGLGGENFQASEDKQGTLFPKVVNYNVVDSQVGFSVPKITDMLRSLNADVICLQGVKGGSSENTDAHAIALQLRMFCVFAQASQDKCFGNAILSYWPLHSVETIKLSPGSEKKNDGSRTPGCGEQRIALAAVVCSSRHNPARDFIVICAHFDVYNIYDAAPVDCLSPVQLIWDFVKTRKAYPALLAGDFNTKPGSPILQDLEKNWNVFEQFYEVPTNKNLKSNSIFVVDNRDHRV